MLFESMWRGEEAGVGPAGVARAPARSPQQKQETPWPRSHVPAMSTLSLRKKEALRRARMIDKRNWRLNSFQSSLFAMPECLNNVVKQESFENCTIAGTEANSTGCGSFESLLNGNKALTVPDSKNGHTRFVYSYKGHQQQDDSDDATKAAAGSNHFFDALPNYTRVCPRNGDFFDALPTPAPAANPLTAHADALSSIEAHAERVRELLHCAAQDDNAAATCRPVQAAYVQRSFRDLAKSTVATACNGPHGSALRTARAFRAPRHGGGHRLKAHGIWAIAVAVNDGAIDRRSEIALPVNRDGGTGMLLGAGALLNAGCSDCCNVRISKMQWCQHLMAYMVYFQTTRAIAAGKELLLEYDVHGARCSCRKPKLLCPPAPHATACMARASDVGRRFATADGAIYAICPLCYNTKWQCF